MINDTLNFNGALTTMLATCLQAKSWQPKPICKQQIYGAEILTKDANPIPWSPLPHCHLLPEGSESLNQKQMVNRVSLARNSTARTKPTTRATERIIHTSENYSRKAAAWTPLRTITMVSLEIDEGGSTMSL